MCYFGIGDEDDRVDALVYALAELKKGSAFDLSKLTFPDFSAPSRWRTGTGSRPRIMRTRRIHRS